MEKPLHPPLNPFFSTRYFVLYTSSFSSTKTTMSSFLGKCISQNCLGKLWNRTTNSKGLDWQLKWALKLGQNGGFYRAYQPKSTGNMWSEHVLHTTRIFRWQISVNLICSVKGWGFGFSTSRMITTFVHALFITRKYQNNISLK